MEVCQIKEEQIMKSSTPVGLKNGFTDHPFEKQKCLLNSKTLILTQYWCDSITKHRPQMHTSFYFGGSFGTLNIQTSLGRISVSLPGVNFSQPCSSVVQLNCRVARRSARRSLTLPHNVGYEEV